MEERIRRETTQSHSPSHETLRLWSAPTSRTRRPEKSAPRAKSGIAEFCPKVRHRCASRQSTPRGFPLESRGIGSYQGSLVGLIGHCDREPREKRGEIGGKIEACVAGEAPRGRLSKRISSGEVLQKSLGA